jgi:hypothetical protein
MTVRVLSAIGLAATFGSAVALAVAYGSLSAFASRTDQSSTGQLLVFTPIGLVFACEEQLNSDSHPIDHLQP